MSRPNRVDLMRAMRLAEERVRWVSAQLTLPGSVRLILLQVANMLARMIERDERSRK